MKKRVASLLICLLILAAGYQAFDYLTAGLCSYEELKSYISESEDIVGEYEGDGYSVFMTKRADEKDVSIKMYEEKRWNLYPYEPSSIDYPSSEGTRFYEAGFVWVMNRSEAGLNPVVSVQYGAASEEMDYVEVHYGNGDTECLKYSDGYLFLVTEPEDDPHYILNGEYSDEKITEINYVKSAVSFDFSGKAVDTIINSKSGSSSKEIA